MSTNGPECSTEMVHDFGDGTTRPCHAPGPCLMCVENDTPPRPVGHTAEQAEVREQAIEVIRETVGWAMARTKAGRSSMPIYVEDAMALVVLAARAVDATDELAQIIREASDA